MFPAPFRPVAEGGRDVGRSVVSNSGMVRNLFDGAMPRVLFGTNFACIQGQAVPRDGQVENIDPDFLKLGKVYDGVRMIKQLLVDIDERYPKTEYLGFIRRDDSCDATWTCLKYMERALPRLGYKASFVDLSLPKAANGDENLVPDGFNNMNFNAKTLAKNLILNVNLLNFI